MSELALYRKYRSANWGEVVGQPQIVATLQQAVASGRTSHAYLLTGPRGVGKTSVARILARSLNCTDSPKPCGQCANCQAALAGNLDIIEIDGASNRGIDEIRELRDKINLAPSFGTYKIYIIDEVHMLTEAAFNALLKTLEEPPAHAVFVLATTEAHKLPATIISRTQRFNFRAIEPTVISEHLTQIAAKESITISPEALVLLGQAAGGSFRDGLSLLDQVAALGGEVSLDDVRLLLGWGSESDVRQLVEAILTQQTAQALELVEQLHAAGAQPIQLVNQLMQITRQRLHEAVRAKSDATGAARLLDSLILAAKSPLPQYALEAAIARFQETPAAAPKPVGKISAPAPKSAPEAVSPAPAPVAETLPAPSPANDDFDSRWLKALAEIKATNNSLYALLCSCGIHPIDNGLEILARFSFHRDRLLEAKNLGVIEAAAKRAFAKPMRVVASLKAEAAPTKSADPAGELVSSALEILGGEVVE